MARIKKERMVGSLCPWECGKETWRKNRVYHHMAWVCNLLLPLACYLTLTKSLNLSEPQFCHQQNGNESICLIKLLWGLNDENVLMSVNCLTSTRSSININHLGHHLSDIFWLNRDNNIGAGRFDLKLEEFEVSRVRLNLGLLVLTTEIHISWWNFISQNTSKLGFKRKVKLNSYQTVRNTLWEMWPLANPRVIRVTGQHGLLYP